MDRPEKELKAFAKMRLEAGESQTVRLDLDARAFAYFEFERGAWMLAPGVYDLKFGTDAMTTHLTESVSRAKEIVLKP